MEVFPMLLRRQHAIKWLNISSNQRQVLLLLLFYVLLLFPHSQACMEVFPTLLHTKAAYNKFKSGHPAEFKWMLDNAICGLNFDNPAPVACGLQTLYLVGASHCFTVAVTWFRPRGKGKEGA
jgi:hypothetical protein